MGAVRETVTPSAARLTNSLRDVGYDFPAAIADVVDNSLSAGASRVEVMIEFAGLDTTVAIADDGSGMSANGLVEAFRFGSRSAYEAGSLGRFGLGLKTASLSQARSITVASRRSSQSRVAIRRLDLDLISEWDDWLITAPGRGDLTANRARSLLDAGFSTVVIWDRLDRVLPEQRPDGGWARRRVETLISRTREHLAAVFQRFLTDPRGHGDSVTLMVNGEKLTAWHPLAPDEPHTQHLSELTFEVEVGEHAGVVRLERAVLPPRADFSSTEQFDRLSGPLRWNRQQGLYFYRANRLVQWGGWAGLRAIDEHTKLARACLTFETDLDGLFNINVSKMRVSLPAQLRRLLEEPLSELCSTASRSYRSAGQTTLRPTSSGSATSVSSSRDASKAGDSGCNSPPAKTGREDTKRVPEGHPDPLATGPDHGAWRTEESTTVSLALRAAALQTGDYEALRRISRVLAEIAPKVHTVLHLGDL